MAACCGSDGGASLGGRSASTDDSVGGVPVDGLLNLVEALIGCGVSPDVAAQSATTVYVNQLQRGAGSSVVSGSGSRVTRSLLRQQRWHAGVSGLPYQDGQCYLHPVRWGRRSAYLEKLKTNPAFSDFVAMLRPGDLDLQVARDMFLYRVSDATSLTVVYHIATVCPEGELVATVYDAIAGFQRLYPWVNTEFVLEGSGVGEIPLVGTVGRSRVSLGSVGENVASNEDEADVAMVQARESSPESETSLYIDPDALAAVESSRVDVQLGSRLMLEPDAAMTHEVVCVNDDFVGERPSVGKCIEVPAAIKVLLSNGLLVGGEARKVILLLASTVSVRAVSDGAVLREADLGADAFSTMWQFSTAGFRAEVVVRSLGAVTDGERALSCQLFYNGVNRVVLDQPKRYYADVDIGYYDRLTVGVEMGLAQVGPLTLKAGIDVLFLDRDGLIDVPIFSRAPNTRLRLFGVLDEGGN